MADCMSNINDTYFDGHYKEIWRTLIPEGLTNAEIDFLYDVARLKAAASVLDLMCGYGRHSLGLARKGAHVTAVDNLPAYVSEVRNKAVAENLAVTVVNEDVQKLTLTEKFDLAMCMGNSMCFFDKAETRNLLGKISSLLKPSGTFVVHTWLLAEIALKSFESNTWETVDDVKCLYHKKILFFPTRIETDAFFIDSDGSTEAKKGVDYIYSLNEIQDMFREAGLLIRDVWSIPGKKKFSFGEPRAYIVSEKTG